MYQNQTKTNSLLGVERFTEENVVLQRAVHDPRLLRDVSEEAVHGHASFIQFHLAQNGGNQRRLARSDGTANAHQTTLHQVTYLINLLFYIYFYYLYYIIIIFMLLSYFILLSHSHI